MYSHFGICFFSTFNLQPPYQNVPVSSHTVAELYNQSDSLLATVASLNASVRDLVNTMQAGFANMTLVGRTGAQASNAEGEGSRRQSKRGARRRHHSPIPRDKERNDFYVSINSRSVL